MSFDTELVLPAGTGRQVTSFTFSPKPCPGGWANTHVNTYRASTDKADIPATSSPTGVTLPPGTYLFAWNVTFNDSFTPPHLGNQSWIELSDSTQRYGLGASDQNSALDQDRRTTSRGSTLLTIPSTAPAVQLWVCNGHGSTRNTSALTSRTWLYIIKP